MNQYTFNIVAVGYKYVSKNYVIEIKFLAICIKIIRRGVNKIKKWYALFRVYANQF